jgi:hypothetical protein
VGLRRRGSGGRRRPRGRPRRRWWGRTRWATHLLFHQASHRTADEPEVSSTPGARRVPIRTCAPDLGPWGGCHLPVAPSQLDRSEVRSGCAHDVAGPGGPVSDPPFLGRPRRGDRRRALAARPARRAASRRAARHRQSQRRGCRQPRAARRGHDDAGCRRHRLEGRPPPAASDMDENRRLRLARLGFTAARPRSSPPSTPGTSCRAPRPGRGDERRSRGPQRVLGFGAARPGMVPWMKLGSRSWTDATPSRRRVRTSSWCRSWSMRVTPASPPRARP